MVHYSDVRLPAYALIPHKHAIQCLLGDNPNPQWVEIVHKTWSEDRVSVVFMLETHNFLVFPYWEVRDAGERELNPHQKIREEWLPEAFMAARLPPLGTCDPLPVGVPCI